MTETTINNEPDDSRAAIRAICASNARAIAAQAERNAELANTVNTFIKRLDNEGLRISLITDISDDQAGELLDLRERSEDTDLRIQALRSDEQAEANRQAFRDALEVDRQEWRASFRAHQEIIQTLLVELARTNNRVENLEAS